MKAPIVISVVLLTAGVQTGCVTDRISPEDMAAICKVSADKIDASPAHRPNLLSNPVVGPVFGVTGGAIGGATYGGIPGMIGGAVIGGATGIVCGVATLFHLNADNNFQSILKGTNADTLTQSLRQELGAGAGQCRSSLTAENHDKLLQIEKIEVAQGCSLGKQGITAYVHWRIV